MSLQRLNTTVLCGLERDTEQYQAQWPIPPFGFLLGMISSWNRSPAPHPYLRLDIHTYRHDTQRRKEAERLADEELLRSIEAGGQTSRRNRFGKVGLSVALVFVVAVAMNVEEERV